MIGDISNNNMNNNYSSQLYYNNQMGTSFNNKIGYNNIGGNGFGYNNQHSGYLNNNSFNNYSSLNNNMSFNNNNSSAISYNNNNELNSQITKKRNQSQEEKLSFLIDSIMTKLESTFSNYMEKKISHISEDQKKILQLFEEIYSKINTKENPKKDDYNKEYFNDKFSNIIAKCSEILTKCNNINTNIIAIKPSESNDKTMQCNLKDTLQNTNLLLKSAFNYF